MANRLVSVDSASHQFPTEERQTIAANIEDDATVEGAAVSTAIDAVTSQVHASRYGLVAGSVSSTIAAANSAAINTAVAALPATGGTVVLPAGNYYVNGAITIPVNVQVQIAGQGMTGSGNLRYGTFIQRHGASTAPVISAVGTGDASTQRVALTLRDIGIHGGNVAVTAVKIERATEVTMDRVRISSTPAEALTLLQVWNALIANTYVVTSGDSASSKAAVLISSPAGVDSSNGITWVNGTFEANNGVSLRVDGDTNFGIRHHFTNMLFEDATAATWPLIELNKSAATVFSNFWMMKGKRSGDLRATGPLVKVNGPFPTNSGELRAHVFTGGVFSYWGDPNYLIEQDAGALVLGDVTFTGLPDVAYVHVASAVSATGFELGTHHAEQRSTVLHDERTSRRGNTNNGHRGAIAPSAIGYQTGLQTVAANVGRFARFVPTRNMRVTKIGFAVTTAHSTDLAVDAGIYDATGARIVSSGATTAGMMTTGAKTVAITPTYLEAGVVYYVGVSFGSGGISGALISADFRSYGGATLFGTGAGNVEVDAITSTHPLPSTLTFSGTQSAGWLMSVRED